MPLIGLQTIQFLKIPSSKQDLVLTKTSTPTSRSAGALIKSLFHIFLLKTFLQFLKLFLHFDIEYPLHL